MSKVYYPRALAVRILTRVLSDHQLLDESLRDLSTGLPSTSMGWLQEICSGTLRWKGRLEVILDSTALKKKPSGWLRKILLLACYQLIVQEGTPAAVVVSETVAEVKRKEGEAPARFANACLRKVADHAAHWRRASPDFRSEVEVAQWHSLPLWLWRKIVQQQGQEWAQAFAQASLDRPTLWLRTKEGPVIGQSGAVTEIPGFTEGEWIVQDISSQHLIAEAVQIIRSRIGLERKLNALDLCAAPGGKAVGLAWSGMQVTATDFSEKRLPLLKQTVERVNSDQIQVIPWSQLDSYWNQDLKPDLIWVDAPCSGTGILRRHPDVRWLRREEELADLVKSQRELLRRVWDQVKSGGFLVYSVCSVLKEEGPEAITELGLDSFLKKKWFLSPQEAPFGDGFCAALLQKEDG